MKKLRLLMTSVCLKSCEGCCNKDYNLSKLPKVSHLNYDEILLTGGEPMLYPDAVISVAKLIRAVNPNTKIYLYTSKFDVIEWKFMEALNVLHGITCTLHTQEDAVHFANILHYIQQLGYAKHKSLQLHIFKGVDIDSVVQFNRTWLRDWKVKENIEWIENCPLPEGEEFRTL